MQARVRVPTLLALTLVGGSAVAATSIQAAVQASPGLSGPVRFLDVTPARVDGEGEVTLRYRVVGSPFGPGTTRLEVDAWAADKRARVAPYGGASVSITSVVIESPATLVPEARPQPALVPACSRGHARIFNGGSSFTMHVPANTAPLLTVTVEVPRGVRGSYAGVAVGAQLLQVPGFATPAIALPPVMTPIRRTGLRPAITLKQRPAAGGRVRVSGTVRGVKTGTRVELVGRTGLGSDVDAVGALGTDEQAFAPLGDGLRRFAAMKTRKGGRFATTLKLPDDVALLARTRGKPAGASCPVAIDRVAEPASR